MAEPAPARAQLTHSITVSLNAAPNPLQTTVNISDTITIVVTPPSPISLWTWDGSGNRNNIFVGETGNAVPCSVGRNGPFSFNTSVVSPGQSVEFQANAQGDVATSVKGTIMIQSQSGDKKK
jgi:hypothetical protein